MFDNRLLPQDMEKRRDALKAFDAHLIRWREALCAKAEKAEEVSAAASCAACVAGVSFRPSTTSAFGTASRPPVKFVSRSSIAMRFGIRYRHSRRHRGSNRIAVGVATGIGPVEFRRRQDLSLLLPAVLAMSPVWRRLSAVSRAATLLAPVARLAPVVVYAAVLVCNSIE